MHVCTPSSTFELKTKRWYKLWLMEKSVIDIIRCVYLVKRDISSVALSGLIPEWSIKLNLVVQTDAVDEWTWGYMVLVVCQMSPQDKLKENLKRLLKVFLIASPAKPAFQPKIYWVLKFQFYKYLVWAIMVKKTKVTILADIELCRFLKFIYF